MNIFTKLKLQFKLILLTLCPDSTSNTYNTIYHLIKNFPCIMLPLLNMHVKNIIIPELDLE